MNETQLSELLPGRSHIFIQALDVSSGLVVAEKYCGPFNVSPLEEILGCKPGELFSNNVVYLEEGDGEKIGSLLGLDSDVLLELDPNKHEDISLVVQAWSPGNQLPYRVHTNRELILMLENRKPLSVFVGRIPADTSFTEIPEHLFDPYVESGVFSKQELVEEFPQPVRGIKGHRIVLYANSGEEWRINAYSIVRHVGNKIGWSEPLIRLEGSLLGYAEWQNDAFILGMKK